MDIGRSMVILGCVVAIYVEDRFPRLITTDRKARSNTSGCPIPLVVDA
jgi:hypothetical protein